MNSSADNLSKTFWRYVIPSTAALLVGVVYQIVDGFFIGHIVGEEGLAAINMAWPIAASLIGLGLMVGIGAGASYSIEMGKGNPKEARKYLSQSLWLMFLLYIPIAGALYFGSEYFLDFQNASPIHKEMGLEFVQLLIIMTPIISFGIAAPLLIRNLGFPVLATVMVAIGTVVKVICDYIFIVVMDKGLFGTAIATVIGEGAVSIMAIAIIMHELRLTRADLKLNLRYGFKILKIGLASMILYMYISGLIMLYNKLLMKYGGGLYVATYAIMGYCITLVFMVLDGVASGIQPLISYFFGANQLDNMNKTIKMGFKVCFTAVFALSILFLGFPAKIMGFFVEDPAILEIGKSAIRISMSLMILDAFIVIVDIFFQSIGEAKKAITISVANTLIKIPFIFVLSHMFGITGIWLTAPTSNVVLGAVVAYLFFKEQKRLRTRAVPLDI